MLVKNLLDNCSIGTKVEVQWLKNGELTFSKLERGTGCIKCETKDYLEIYELEILFFRATGNDEMTVYCGEWE